jgi:hypothetical protein
VMTLMTPCWLSGLPTAPVGWMGCWFKPQNWIKLGKSWQSSIGTLFPGRRGTINKHKTCESTKQFRNRKTSGGRFLKFSDWGSVENVEVCKSPKWKYAIAG